MSDGRTDLVHFEGTINGVRSYMREVAQAQVRLWRGLQVIILFSWKTNGHHSGALDDYLRIERISRLNWFTLSI